MQLVSFDEVLEWGAETPFPNTVQMFKETPYCFSCPSLRATVRCVECGVKHCAGCEPLAQLSIESEKDADKHAYELVLCDKCWRGVVETGRPPLATLFEPFPSPPRRLRRIQPLRVVPRVCECHHRAPACAAHAQELFPELGGERTRSEVGMGGNAVVAPAPVASEEGAGDDAGRGGEGTAEEAGFAAGARDA